MTAYYQDEDYVEAEISSSDVSSTRLALTCLLFRVMWSSRMLLVWFQLYCWMLNDITRLFVPFISTVSFYVYTVNQ